jgi:hypothetical protein
MTRHSHLSLVLAILVPIILALLLLSLIMAEWMRHRQLKLRTRPKFTPTEETSSETKSSKVQAVFYRPASSFAGSLLHPRPALVSHRTDTLAGDISSDYLFVHPVRREPPDAKWEVKDNFSGARMKPCVKIILRTWKLNPTIRGCRVMALFSYHPNLPDEMMLSPNMVIKIDQLVSNNFVLAVRS